MTLASVVVLIGCLAIIVIQYRTIRHIKTEHKFAVEDFLRKMQEIVQELSFLRGENEAVKDMQQLMLEAMSIFGTRAEVVVPHTGKKRRKRRSGTVSEPDDQEEGETPM